MTGDPAPVLLETRSPVDGRVYDDRRSATSGELDAMMAAAAAAQPAWAATALDERVARLSCAVERLTGVTDGAASELAWQMGRPVSQGPGELARTGERARYMLGVAPSALAEIAVTGDAGRSIAREPIGTVLVIAPWNYPYLTAINAIVPALAAGNAVVLKHSPQVPLVADRFARAFAEAGLPGGVFQVLHASDSVAQQAVCHPATGHIVFTGSVAVGRTVAGLAASHLKSVTLELGGKDAAYVRADADIAFAAEQLADGAFYNSGQSCCSIERIYVHEAIADEFLEALSAHARALPVGNPLASGCKLGPMARPEGAALVRSHVNEALASGARALIDTAALGEGRDGPCYLAPQILTGVSHAMTVMRDETFGPVVGVMTAASDEHAVSLVNDSPFGLTASLWSEDLDRCAELARALDVGTVFANRCDYLDPAMPWSGRKSSGLGLSLSAFAYATLTRPKSEVFRPQPRAG